MRGFIFGILFTMIVIVVGGYIALRNGVIPANADAKPGWFETWAAGTSLDATLDREARKSANPVPLTDANLIAGIEIYRDHCAICHATAKGEASASPVAKGDIGHRRNWRRHGIRCTGMPSRESTLSDQKIWTLPFFSNIWTSSRRLPSKLVNRFVARRLADLVAALEPVPERRGIDLASLYGENLVSGVVSGIE